MTFIRVEGGMGNYCGRYVDFLLAVYEYYYNIRVYDETVLFLF